MPKFQDEIDVVQSNTLSKQGSPITTPPSSTENLMIINTLAAGANHPANKATRFLEGAVLTITNPHLSVDSTLFPDSEFTKPTTYEKKITKVVNGTNVVMPPYKITRKSDGQTRAVPLNNFTFSITYEKTVVKPNTSGTFKKSYADIQYSNLQTFSGDVYKAKIFTKEKGSQGDYEKIGEVVLDGQNQLINPEGVTGFETIGIYHTQSIIEDGWVTSSNSASATQGEDDIAASVLLSGSNAQFGTITGSDFTFVTKTSYGLQRGEDYMVSFDTYFNKSNKADAKGDISETAELEVFLTGSINSPTASEVSLGRLDHTFEGMVGRSEGRIDGVFNYFKTHNKAAVLPEAKLGFRVKAGNFKLANVSLTPYFEKNFNPVSFRTLLPMPKPVKRGQRFDFYTEFYDFNNNKSNFQAETSASVIFDGAPEVFAQGTGSDSGLVTGSIFLGSTTGSGIELHGGSAYMRSIGYDGFDDTISNSLGGFIIFSGSVQSQIGASETYEGVGLEIVDAHGDTNRFLKFKTNAEGTPSEFEIQTDTFFLGKEGQFISGSNGNIIISSSNFFLGSQANFVSGSNGNLKMSSSAFHLGSGNESKDGALSAGAFISSSTTNSSTGEGNLTISSSNFHLSGSGRLNAGNGSFVVDESGDVTLTGVITAETGGTIGGFTIGANDLSVGSGTTLVKIASNDKKIQIGAKASLTDSNAGVHIGTDGIALGASSVFKVTNAGVVTAANITATGGTIGGFTITDSKIESSDFVSGLKGVRISTEQNGLIEAENAKIRGTLSTTTFEKESVNAVGGQLHIANATMVTGSTMGINDLSASVANVSGFTIGEVVIAKKVSGTGFNTEYMRVHSSSRLSTDDNNQSGLLFVTRSFSGSTIAATGSEGFRGEAFGQSSSYEPGQVLVSTGVSGSGYIRLNANPRDLATPYIDIIERTGSGVYDTELKARLGDLSGLAASKVGSAAGFGLFTEKAFLTQDVTVGTLGTEHITIDGTSIRFIDNTTTMAELRGTTWTIGGAHGATDDVIVLSPGGGVAIQDSSNDKVVVDSDGVTITENNQVRAIFGATSVIGSEGAAVTSTSTDDCIRIADGTVSIFQDTNNKAVVDSSGLAITQGGAGVASFGANSIITGGTITLRNSTNNNDKVILSQDKLQVFDNNTDVASFGAITRIGAIANNHISMSSDGLSIKTAADVTVLSASADGITMSGSITAGAGKIGGMTIDEDSIFTGTKDTAGFASNNGDLTVGTSGIHSKVFFVNTSDGSAGFAGTVTIGGTDLTTGNTLNTNTTLGNVGLSLADISGSISGSYLNSASSSMAARVKIESTGISIDNASGTSLASLTNSLRVGVVGNDKSRLEIDSSGNLEIINRQGSTDSTVISLDNAGDATFSGTVTATAGEIGGWTIDSTQLKSEDNSIILDEGSDQILVSGSTFQGGDEKEVRAKLSGSRGNRAEGAVIAIEREGIIADAADVQILKLTTSQSYDDPTDYTNNVDKKAMTMTFADGNNTGGNAKATGSRGVSGSYGAASWGGPIFFKADANNNLQDFELSTAMASDEMMDSGEANNVVEVTFDELQVRFKDVDGGTNKAQFQYKIQVFQGDANASASSELVSEFRFSDVLTQGVNSGLNIPPVTLNKQFFFLQLSGTGYDEINSTHADGNTFELHGGDGQQGTATPIQGTQFLPKVRLNGLGFQTYAGANQHVTFGADNKIVGDMYVRKTSTATRGNMFVQGSVAVGGLAIDSSNELFVDGNIAATGNITAFFTSDERLKNNVVKIENGLSIVNQLRPVEFEWDEESPFYHDKFRDYGLIAQEVEKVLPNIVGEMKDGYKGIKYEKIIPFLIDSIQQLTKRVEELEDK